MMKNRVVAAGQSGLLAVLSGLCLLPALARAQANGPDLVVRQALLGTASAGGSVSIRITVTNIGNASATSFLLIGGVSDPANLNSIGGGTAACAKGRNAVYTCSLPGLVAGGSADLLLSAKVGPGVSFISNANANGGGDVNPNNSRSALTVPILAAAPDVQMSGSASDRSPNANQQIDFQYQVKVSGGPATGVVFTDALPAELSLVSASASNGARCALESGVMRCDLGDIPAGSQVQITVSVLAPQTVGVSVTNTATAFAGDGRDSNASNNSVSIAISTR